MPEAIFLERDEGLAAAEAKLAATTEPQVWLVVTRGNAELRDPLKLRLLRRHADYLARELVLVTTDRKTREVAAALGVPTRRSAGRLGRPPSVWQVAGTLIRGTFSLGLIAACLAGIGLLVLYVLPSATVTLVPPAESLSEVLEITASRKASGVDLTKREIPARPLEIVLDGTDSLPATGKRKSGDAPAMGQVTFLNRTGVTVTVPGSTILETGSGVKFRTIADAELPSQQWATARVGVIAEEPGPEGNADRLAINRVENLALSLQVSVINEQPTSGGTAREALMASADDYARLKNRLVDRLKAEVADRVYKQRQANESIYPETLRLTIVDERYDPPVGEPAESVSLRVRAIATGLAFEGSAANDLATKVLAGKIGQGSQLVPGTFKTAPLEAFSADADTVSFRLRAEARAAPKIDEDELRRELRGKSIADATSLLESRLRLAERPQVVVEPAWTRTLPWLDQRITIKVQSRR